MERTYVQRWDSSEAKSKSVIVPWPTIVVNRGVRVGNEGGYIPGNIGDDVV